MPFKSEAQRKFLYAKHPAIAKRWSAEFPNQRKLPLHVKNKKKPKIVINNKMKAFGQTDTHTRVVEINKKKHKGDKKQLADTIKHELYHVKHPKATEKETYKNTGKLENMPLSEQNSLIAKLRNKKMNYKTGALKRKLHLKGNLKPGDMISKMNEQKRSIKSNNRPISKERLAIMGMV